MKRLSVAEQELQEFHSATKRGADVDAHALGVLPDPADEDMESLLRLDRERLLERHTAKIHRLHEGIRARAVEHAEQVAGLERHASELGDVIRGLRGDRRKLGRRVDYLVMAIAAAAMFALYFAVRDIGCPITMPWNFH